MPDIYRYSGVLKNKLEFQVHMLQGVNVIVNLCVNLTRLQHNVIESNTRLDVVVVQLLSRVRRFVTPWTVAYQALPSMGFFRQECWSGVHFLLQEIFPTQGLNPGFPHCR